MRKSLDYVREYAVGIYNATFLVLWSSLLSSIEIARMGFIGYPSFSILKDRNPFSVLQETQSVLLVSKSLRRLSLLFAFTKDWQVDEERPGILCPLLESGYIPAIFTQRRHTFPQIEFLFELLCFKPNMFNYHTPQQWPSKPKRQSHPSAANSSNYPTMPPPPIAKWPSIFTCPLKPPPTPSTKPLSSST